MRYKQKKTFFNPKFDQILTLFWTRRSQKMFGHFPVSTGWSKKKCTRTHFAPSTLQPLFQLNSVLGHGKYNPEELSVDCRNVSILR